MASAEGLAQRAARGIGRTRGGAVVAPRDVFWWRSNAAPRRTLGSADDLICTQYGRISLPRRRLPRGVPVAGTCRTRVKVHACARLLSCAHRTRFASRARRTLWARLRHDVLHALLRTSARRPPTCSPLPHQRRLAIMLEACLRHDSRVREDATRVGEEGETGTRRWEENVSFGSKADLE